MLCFNSLPPEVHLEIFSFLSASEVIKIRQVCKQWNCLINEFKFKLLRCKQLTTPYDPRESQYDFHFVSIRGFLNYTSSDHKFSRIKYLEAKLSPNYHQLADASKFLNSFKALKEASLRLCFRNSAEVQATFVISLNSLEKAMFDFRFESNVNVLLHLPNLLCVGLKSLESITIGYPDKLRFLAIKDPFEDGLDFSKFTNLETLYTDGRYVRLISPNFIKILPSLKELHSEDFYFSNWIKEIRSFKRSPIDERLTKPPSVQVSPRIFHYGFEIGLDQLDGEQLPDSFGSILTKRINLNDSTRFIVRNLHRSRDNNTYVSSLHYGQLAELSDFLMFDVLPQKFPKINHLHISDNVADENRLLRFIDSIKPEELSFETAALSRSFFEKLPEDRPYIWHLQIKNEPTINILSGDFDFVFKLTKLGWLEFDNCPLPLKFVARLLEERINLVRFSQPGGYDFKIDRSMNCIKILTRFAYLDFKFHDLPKLPNFLRAQSNGNEFADPGRLISSLRNSFCTRCRFRSFENE